LALDEFVLQIFQGRVVELKLPLEGAVSQAAASLQHGNRVVEDLLKGHRTPFSMPMRYAEDGVAWDGSCGGLYSADGY
jgi:hypothetical protein